MQLLLNVLVLLVLVFGVQLLGMMLVVHVCSKKGRK